MLQASGLVIKAKGYKAMIWMQANKWSDRSAERETEEYLG